jgi:plastocyanin
VAVEIRAAMRACVAVCGLAAALAPAAHAASLSAKIVDKKGEAVEGAVLLAFTAGGGPGTKRPAIVDVDQVNKEFVPRVSAVAVGTPIRFPNYDQIRHHVYSFSPAKSFEIPLYKGVPADPIVFDKAGVVTLGCNIHDWMQGYVLVTEASYFATSDASGAVKLEGLPAGTVRLQVWHPNLEGQPEDNERSLELGPDASQALTFEIARKRTWNVRRGGGRGGDSYR